MKFKFGLRLKFILIFVIFSVIISGAIIVYSDFSFQVNIMKKYSDHATAIAKLTASVIDGDQITEFALSQKKTQSYEKLQEVIDNIKNQTGVYYLYVMYPLNEEKGIYIFDARLTKEQEELVGAGSAQLGQEVVFGNDFTSAMKVMKTGEPSDYFDITDTKQGQIYEKLASAYAPIVNSQGKVIAFVGVDVAITEIEQFVDEASYQMAEVVEAIVILCMLVLILIMQKSVIRPVRMLKAFAEEITEAKFEHHIQIRGHDEISEISSVFNRMAGSIEGHMNEIRRINDAYHKFVPSRIFELLNKPSVTDVQLGNQTYMSLSILNFQVVGFPEMIRKMQGMEMFHFINHVLNSVLPYVIERDGVAETFQDAGFSAFFAGECEAGLACAVSMCQQINLMNKEEGIDRSKPLEVGIGLTYGSVMLGIVGHDKRLSTISISEHTQAAKLLVNLGTKYNARIIITNAAVNRIERFSKVYHSRFLGFIYYSAVGQLEKLYDVFDGDEEEEIRLKLQTKATFEKGVKLFCARQFSEARLHFVNVLKVFRRDHAAREYLYLCNQYSQMEDCSQVDIYIEKL